MKKHVKGCWSLQLTTHSIVLQVHKKMVTKERKEAYKRAMIFLYIILYFTVLWQLPFAVAHKNHLNYGFLTSKTRLKQTRNMDKLVGIFWVNLD